MVDLAVLGLQLDSRFLKVFSNLNDSIILSLGSYNSFGGARRLMLEKEKLY